jgi:hypothetical protein
MENYLLIMVITNNLELLLLFLCVKLVQVLEHREHIQVRFQLVQFQLVQFVVPLHQAKRTFGVVFRVRGNAGDTETQPAEVERKRDSLVQVQLLNTFLAVHFLLL